MAKLLSKQEVKELEKKPKDKLTLAETVFLLEKRVVELESETEELRTMIYQITASLFK